MSGRGSLCVRLLFGIAAGILLLAGFARTLGAQTLDENALKAWTWRQIGPFRGGRALAATGVAGDPATY
jgi:hypothetical protein